MSERDRYYYKHLGVERTPSGALRDLYEIYDKRGQLVEQAPSAATAKKIITILRTQGRQAARNYSRAIWTRYNKRVYSK